jgi:tetratricopeptide (TPR) repeat protein
VRPWLTELTRASLITEHTPGRYAFHDLLRSYATEIAHAVETDADRGTCTRQMLDYYLHTAHAAAHLLNPRRTPAALPLQPPSPGTAPDHFGGHQQAMTWLSAERQVLLAALHHAADAGFDTYCWQLAWTLQTFLDLRGHWHDLAAAWQTALLAAGRQGSQPAQAHAYRGLARAHTRLGRYPDAHTFYQQALDLYSASGDQVGQAHTHRNLAYLSWRWRQPDRINHHLQQATALFHATGDAYGQAHALTVSGLQHFVLGDYTRARTSHQQALIWYQQTGDRWGQATSWDALGYAQLMHGNHLLAANSYQRSLDLRRKLGNRYGEADTSARLGAAHHAAGNRPAARAAWQHALTILTDLHHPDADAVRAELEQLATDHGPR